MMDRFMVLKAWENMVDVAGDIRNYADDYGISTLGLQNGGNMSDLTYAVGRCEAMRKDLREAAQECEDHKGDPEFINWCWSLHDCVEEFEWEATQCLAEDVRWLALP